MDKVTQTTISLLLSKEQVKLNKIPGVRTVLVVLPISKMAFDVNAIRRNILYSYPDAAIFFFSSSGKSMGVRCPSQIDLLIDLSGQNRQPFLFVKKLRRLSRVAIGRSSGLLRTRIYDRVLKNKTDHSEDEAVMQIFALAGIVMAPGGEPVADKSDLSSLEILSST